MGRTYSADMRTRCDSAATGGHPQALGATGSISKSSHTLVPPGRTRASRGRRSDMSVRQLAAAGVVAALCLSGCSGDGPTPRLSDETSASARTETPAAPESQEPSLPPQASGASPASARAFVQHYYDFINYAQRTGDTAGLRKLGSPSCGACDGGANFIDSIYKRGGRLTGGEYHLVKATVTGRQRVTDKVSLVFLSVVAVHASQTVTGAGDLNNAYPAGRSRLRYRLARDAKGWHVDEWELS